MYVCMYIYIKHTHMQDTHTYVELYIYGILLIIPYIYINIYGIQEYYHSFP